MKIVTLTAAAFIAFAGAASAQETLTTGAVEQIETLSPGMDTSKLTQIQISEINEAVERGGFDESMLMTIVGDMDGMKAN